MIKGEELQWHLDTLKQNAVLKTKTSTYIALVKHLQIELENARLDLCIKNDAINGYRKENIKLRKRINSMYVYDVFGEEV